MSKGKQHYKIKQRPLEEEENSNKKGIIGRYIQIAMEVWLNADIFKSKKYKYSKDQV